MKTVLITGANRSIGFETAKQLLEQGYYVYLGCRDLGKGQQAVKQLQALGLDQVAPVVIDVDNIDSIRAARGQIKALDVLINNAGVSGGYPQSSTETEIGVFREVFETNFFGVVEVTQAFIDLLKQSAAPRIVNVTSGLGSLNRQSDPDYVHYRVKPVTYVASKAALNAYTIVLAYELRDTPFKVNAVDPCYTATDFNNHSGPGTVQDAAKRVVKAAVLGADGPTGLFFSDDNAPDTGISEW
ncbi:SDR family oxidoreductase [Chitinophaga sp.]|uniref:SDR family oxidoreductase n=1 Tax=Chitinophaga sp. TaxID=1869181 RepID=UPI0031D54080